MYGLGIAFSFHCLGYERIKFSFIIPFNFPSLTLFIFNFCSFF